MEPTLSDLTAEFDKQYFSRMSEENTTKPSTMTFTKKEILKILYEKEEQLRIKVPNNDSESLFYKGALNAVLELSIYFLRTYDD